MKGMYRELLRRSMEDAVKEAEHLENEYEIHVPPESIFQMGILLYQYRVDSARNTISNGIIKGIQ